MLKNISLKIAQDFYTLVKMKLGKCYIGTKHIRGLENNDLFVTNFNGGSVVYLHFLDNLLDWCELLKDDEI